MAGAFVFTDYFSGAALTVPRALTPTMPLSNLNDPQPRKRTRFTPLPAGGFNILADLGEDRLVECVALISTTLTAASVVSAFGRIETSTGPTIWTTSFVATADTSPDYNGNVILIPETPVPARYLWIAITPGAAFVDIGRIIAGPLWRLSYAYGYGITEGRMILDRRDRNPITGAEFPVPAVANPRMADFSLPILTPAEARGQHRAMVARLGAAGDALWIPDLALSQAERNARSIFGGVAEPGGSAATVHGAFNVHSRSFRLVERL
jgi:hypothetical protein